jgi:adenylate cyclase
MNSPSTLDTGGDGPRLSQAELAIQSGTSPEEIDRLVGLGLIGRPDADGTFDAGDVTRLRLITALRNAGLDTEQHTTAFVEQNLSVAFASEVIADPVGLTKMTVKEACAETGVPYEAFRRLMLAVGFAASEQDALMREDDLELLRIYAATTELGIPGEVMISTLRSFAISLRRLADAARGLVREYVEDPLLARGVPYREMFESVAKVRIPLQRFAFRATYLLEHRMFEQVVFSNLIARFEEALEHHRAEDPRAFSLRSICFVDLSGFTERTENRGDADAASVGMALVEIAQDQSTLHGGDLVKPLGDGAMLHFVRGLDAIRCAFAIIKVARAAGLPAARAGIAVGPVIVQDGDYYGRTVNRASRLIGVAAPEQVLVTAELVGSESMPGYRFTDLGVVKLKGVTEELHAFDVAED